MSFFRSLCRSILSLMCLSLMPSHLVLVCGSLMPLYLMRMTTRNWRPITLLNVDYKLACCVIAGRLLKVIHLVVDKDQTCGVPGRYIGENVALLRDVTDYATLSNIPIAILSLDQEKAFDRVDWSFMQATLLMMGFNPSCFTMVYKSCGNVNGYLSSFFSLSCGVRQGCPLSPLLYVLVSEVLAANIRAHPRIKGFFSSCFFLSHSLRFRNMLMTTRLF